MVVVTDSGRKAVMSGRMMLLRTVRRGGDGQANDFGCGLCSLGLSGCKGTNGDEGNEVDDTSVLQSVRMIS
jgi:hypothetical protein